KKETPKVEKVEEKSTEAEGEDEVVETKYQKLTGPKISGEKIDLSQFNKPKKKKEEPRKPGTPANTNAANNPNSDANKKKRRRISKGPGAPGTPGDSKPNPNFANRTGQGAK